MMFCWGRVSANLVAQAKGHSHSKHKHGHLHGHRHVSWKAIRRQLHQQARQVQEEFRASKVAWRKNVKKAAKEAVKALKEVDSKRLFKRLFFAHAWL